jgi:hypothetical protein
MECRSTRIAYRKVIKQSLFARSDYTIVSGFLNADTRDTSKRYRVLLIYALYIRLQRLSHFSFGVETADQEAPPDSNNQGVRYYGGG